MKNLRARLGFGFSLLAFFVLPAAAAPAAPKITQPGPNAPLIAQMVARILEQEHYEHKPLDAAASRDILKLYVQDYDPDRMFFERADIAEFKARFGDDLAPRLKEGDVAPAYFIFNRFMRRLRERVDFVHEVLRAKEAKTPLSEKPSGSVLAAMRQVLAVSTAAASGASPNAIFDFSKNESVILDREKSPWLADDQTAREVWRKRLKDDVLEERLNKVKPADQVKDVIQRYDRLLDNYQEFDSTDILQAYLTAMA
ncbi:MAG: hypothetical protein ACREKE_09405, partial [bacterium]